jgi:protein gp37
MAAEATAHPTVGQGSSAIEWTEQTWNPVTGCDRVSPGCAHCYALEMAPRLRAMGNPKYQHVRDGGRSSGPAFGVTLHPHELERPLRWRRPRIVFVNSMSDLFHDEIPYEFIRDVFNVMRSCDGGVTAATGRRRPRHVFQVLTKRPERMLELARSRKLGFDPGSPPSNVWLGVSIENRRYVHRADLLRETPAAVRFISAEPLLGPLVPHGRSYDDTKWGWYTARHFGSEWNDDPGLNLEGIDWLIVGGESGPRHRPMRPEWVRGLRDVCQRDHDDIVGLDRPYEAFPQWARCGTAFFFKQWGGRTPKAGGRELDGRTWDEIPTPVAVAA